MMNCLRNSLSILSRLLPRKPTTVYPLARYYYASRVPLQVQSHRRFFFPSHWRERLPFLRKVTAVGGGAFAMYLGIREVVPYTNRTHFIILPRKLERFIGEDMFTLFKKAEVLPPLHPDSVRVHRIASEIVCAADLDRQRHKAAGLPAITLGAWRRLAEGLGAKPPQIRRSLLDEWEVIVVKADDVVNAVCFPGGKIAVFTGFLNKFREDAEIATVLGHEIAHAVARHMAERFPLFMARCILKFVYPPGLERARMSMLSLRRRMETEADHIGLMLLALAGYDPRVAPLYYEKLGKIVDEKHTRTIKDYHPSGMERARFLSQADVMNKALELYRGVRPCSNPF